MRARESTSLGIVVTLVVVLLFMQTPVMASARSAAWWSWVTTVGRLFQIDGVDPPEGIYAELDRLSFENVRLEAELRDYQRLRQELGTPSVSDRRPILAAVTGRPLDTLLSELMISRGLADGVAVGDPVVVRGSVLIGFVSVVQDSSAVVKTLFHPETALTAEAIHEDAEIEPARGLLKSTFASSLSLTTIPRDSVLEEGQSIVTLASEGNLPYGLLIGKVEVIESQEHSAYQKAKVLPPIDVDSIEAVTVLAQP